MHDSFRKKEGNSEKQQGYHQRQAFCQTQNTFNCFLISLSPVLCTQNGGSGCKTEIQTSKNKCILVRQRGSGHSGLADVSKHHSIRCIYQCTDQILYHDREGQSGGCFQKSFLIKNHTLCHRFVLFLLFFSVFGNVSHFTISCYDPQLYFAHTFFHKTDML